MHRVERLNLFRICIESMVSFIDTIKVQYDSLLALIAQHDALKWIVHDNVCSIYVLLSVHCRDPLIHF